MVRVTEAIDYFKTPGFMAWREKVGTREANAISKKALKIGTRLHEIVASGDYQAAKKDSQEVRNCVLAFNKWRERYQVTTISFPARLNDEAIDLTGEPDFTWVEAETLVDIKTSKEIWPGNFFQLGGYKRLGVQAKRAAILQLDKETGDFLYLTNEDIGLTMEQLVDAFEANFKHYRYYTHIDHKLGREV